MPDVPVVYSGRPIDSSAQTTTRVDFSQDLTLDHESEVPLLTIMSKMQTQSVKSVEFKFAIGRFAPRTTTHAAQVAATAVGVTTVVNVAAGTGVYFNVGDVVEGDDANVDATHTNMLYITIIATDAITVRPYDPATYGVAQLEAGQTIRRIAPATPEGGSGTTSSQTVPTVYTQYCQTFEHYYDVTRIAAAQEQYTGPERSRLREEARKKHVLDQEYALFLSKIVKDVTTTGKPRYQFDGLLAQIQTNVLTYGAALTADELYDFMTDVHNPMYSGGNKRMVLASGDLLGSVNKLATSAIRISTKDTTWGPNITEVQFAGRVWQFVEAPVLSEARPGWGAVIHPKFLKKRPLIDTMYEMNVQNPIDKFSKDGFYTVMAPEIRLEEVFGLIKP
jgi:hypothetical protein